LAPAEIRSYQVFSSDLFEFVIYGQASFCGTYPKDK